MTWNCQSQTPTSVQAHTTRTSQGTDGVMLRVNTSSAFVTKEDAKSLGEYLLKVVAEVTQ